MKSLPVLSTKDLAGINNFLDELQDGAKYQARLADLEAKRAEVNDLIAVYGKASKIDEIVSNALRDEEQARKTLAGALADRTRASEEIAAAKAVSKKFIDEREAAAVKRIADRERDLIENEASINQREEAYIKALNNLEARERQVIADSSQAEEIRKKYTEAVASLTAAIESTRKAL